MTADKPRPRVLLPLGGGALALAAAAAVSAAAARRPAHERPHIPPRRPAPPKVALPKAPEPKPCGGCTLCCKLIGVHELEKPPGLWCRLCNKGKGCGVMGLPERPASCGTFDCLWRQAGLEDELRPDRSKVVFGTTADGVNLVAYVDPGYPDAFRKGAAGDFIKRMLGGGVQVVVVVGKQRKLLGVDGRQITEAVIEAAEEKA